MPDVAAATAKLEASNRNDLAILRTDTIPGVGRTLLALRRDLQAIRGNPRNSIQAMTDDTAAARAKAQASLDTLEATAKMAIGNIRDDIASRLEVKRDDSQQLVYEMQKASARRKIDQAQAAGVSAEEIIRRAAGLGDTVALACLREDIPFSSPTTGDNAQKVHLEALMDLLDLAETPLLSAMQQAARLLEAELATGSANLTTSFALARGEASGASATSGGTLVGPVTTVADWPRGRAYTISFPMDATADGGNSAPPTAGPPTSYR